MAEDTEVFDKIDPLYLALTYHKYGNYDKSLEICNELLETERNDRAVTVLKMMSLTQQARMAGDDDEEDLADTLEGSLVETAINTAARPGTTLRTAAGKPPSTGVVRPGTRNRPSTGTARASTTRAALKTASRVIQTATGAGYRPEVQWNLQSSQYANVPAIAKALFEYLLYQQGEPRKALELALQANQSSPFPDWWWKWSLARCYFSLNMVREAEVQLRDCLKLHRHVDLFLKLARLYIRLNQPVAALEVCDSGLGCFHGDVSLHLQRARIYEGLGSQVQSVREYRVVATHDAMNVEAIACIAVYHYLNDQPELALRYYRRILAMGCLSAELCNNIGLCCLSSFQIDLIMSCFSRALYLTRDSDSKAEIWFNLSHFATLSGDADLVEKCLRCSLAFNSQHRSARKNLTIMMDTKRKREKINMDSKELPNAVSA